MSPTFPRHGEIPISSGSRMNFPRPTNSSPAAGRSARTCSSNGPCLCAAPNQTPVKIDSLQGITIAEIDWKPLIKDARPELDPLADKLPADQHVVFFPSFQAALAVADETKQHDTPVLRLAQPRSEDEGVVERYQRQLGLPLSTLARLLGPTLVKSVALTGSDPLVSPLGPTWPCFGDSPAGNAEQRATGPHRPGRGRRQRRQGRPRHGRWAAYQGFVSPDRVVSSYVAAWTAQSWSRTRSISCSNWPPFRDGKVKAPGRAPRVYLLPHPLSPRRRSPLAFRERGRG